MFEQNSKKLESEQIYWNLNLCFFNYIMTIYSLKTMWIQFIFLKIDISRSFERNEIEWWIDRYEVERFSFLLQSLSEFKRRSFNDHNDHYHHIKHAPNFRHWYLWRIELIVVIIEFTNKWFARTFSRKCEWNSMTFIIWINERSVLQIIIRYADWRKRFIFRPM